MPTFESKRAWLKGPDYFKRFVVQGDGEPLASAGLDASVELLIAERNGHRAGFAMRELARPHGAQGEFAGEPYLVSF